jgi:hypothetical protein
MLQDYNESRLKSPFRTFYSRYNYLVCDYKLTLTLTMGNSVYLIRAPTYGGCRIVISLSVRASVTNEVFRGGGGCSTPFHIGT